MAGEHILKLLAEERCRIDNGDRWLVCNYSDAGKGIEYIVYEHKPYQKKIRILIETEDEQTACRILKGE